MNHSNSGLAHGTSGSPQLTFENGETDAKVRENEKKVEENYNYDHNSVINAINNNNISFLRNELSKTAPIHIPKTAEIKSEHKKNGYEQVSYKWTYGEYNYLCRWHTHTPNAPEYSQDTWVVERRIPGIGYGKNRRSPTEEVMVSNNNWISKKEWKEAVIARKKGTATKKQKEILDNGHWNANKQ